MVSGNILAQTLQGTVIDAISGEPLTGAIVHVVGLQNYATADNEGDYIIRDIPIGRYTIECRMTGYESQQQVEVQINAHHATVSRLCLLCRSCALWSTIGNR